MTDLTTECARVREDLGADLDEELSPEVRAVVGGHLAACPACREQRELLAAVRETVRRLPRHRPGESLRGRVLARIRAESAPPAGASGVSVVVVRERAGNRRTEVRRITRAHPSAPSPPLKPALASPDGATAACSRHRRTGGAVTVTHTYRM